MDKRKAQGHPIVIYQMGKVGSTALHAALFGNRPVFHLHSLLPAKVDYIKQQLMKQGLGVPVHIADSQIFFAKYLYPGAPLTIICPIRHPLDRNISAFFQQLSTNILLHNDLREGLGISNVILTLRNLPIPYEYKCLLVDIFTQGNVRKNIDFLSQYFKTRFSHRTPLDWFDLELKPALGINVYDTPFNLEAGHQEYSGGNVRLLIFRSELADNVKEQVISEFIGFSVARLNRAHTTSDKIYSSTYEKFKESLYVEKPLLDIYHQSAFMKKFYGDYL
ncbi:MAG: hypothetical protein IPL46_03270 [Saprospiraceae bacterium]|nr:hypothetical protein [Saprospiraceae bacterium]